MKPKLYIIKIGGALIDQEDELEVFLKKFATIPEAKILVHGGGKLTTTLAEQLHVPQNMVNGRRVTDAKTLDIATMVYAGKINKTIVAKLQSYDCDALGISGADANVIQAEKREVEEVDFGYVGDVSSESVNKKRIKSFLKIGLTPVFSAITHDHHGALYNTNADSIASVLAQALSKKYDVELVYCFDKDGIMIDLDDPTSLVPLLDNEKQKELMEKGCLNKGILPKLKNAFLAKENDVHKVFLINETKLLEHINHGNQGTEICL